MSTEDRPSLGKFGKKSLEDYVFPYLDSSNATITSPRFGSDYNAVALDDEKVLVVSTDPLAVSPQLGWGGWTPTPRKLKPASITIAEAKLDAAITINGPVTFGST